MKSLLDHVHQEADHRLMGNVKYTSNEVHASVKIVFESMSAAIGFDAAALFVSHCILKPIGDDESKFEAASASQAEATDGQTDGGKTSHGLEHRFEVDSDCSRRWRLFYAKDLPLNEESSSKRVTPKFHQIPQAKSGAERAAEGTNDQQNSGCNEQDAMGIQVLSIPAANLLDSPAMNHVPDNCKSVLTVPLRKEGITLGQLVIYKVEPFFFDSEQIHQIETFTPLLTMILQSSDQTQTISNDAEPHQEFQGSNTADQWHTLAAISAKLKSADSADELGGIFLREVVSISDGLGSAIYIADLGESVFKLWAQHPHSPDEEYRGAHQLDMKHGLLAAAAQGKEPLVYHWAENSQEIHMVSSPPAAAAELGIQYGAVLLPMTTSQEKLVGILLLHLDENQVLDPETIPVLQSIAKMAADVLNRASTMDTLEQLVGKRTQELRSANEQLLELDKLKNKFIEDVSHEFRTPLTSIGLYLKLLEKEQGERPNRYINALKRQTDQLSHLVNSILDISVPERITGLGNCADIELVSMIEELLEVKRPYAEANGLTLKPETLDHAEVLVYGNRDALQRAISNLLDNAINYTAAGAIDVVVSTLDRQVNIGIRDTGRGIPEADLDHIFDRFYRGTQVSQLSIPGTGLGLSMVKKITEQHGGRVEVESKFGEGSVFRIWLPILEKTESSVSLAETEPQTVESEKHYKR